LKPDRNSAALPHGETRAATRVALSYAAIVAVSLVACLPSISRHSYFLGDDFGLVQHLHDLPLDRLFSYFVSDWTESIYGYTLDELRPVLAFTYWFDSHVFGAANAPAYHVTNIALHVLNSLLVFAIARAIASARTDLALLAASLFALIPSHAEPIAWISGRVDSLAAAFYLGAFLCFIRFRSRQAYRWLAVALVLFALGLFSKQSIVTFPLVILAYDAVYGPSPWSLTRRQLVSRCVDYVPFAAVLILYLGLRATLFGNAVRESQLTVGTVKSFVTWQPFYIRQMLPVPAGIPPEAKTAVAVLLCGALAAGVLWPLARWRNDRQTVRHLIFFGPIWYSITIAPMIVSGYLSARHVYLTAAGVSIALASLLLHTGWQFGGWGKAARGVAIGVVIFLYAIALTSNVRGWIANGIDSQRFAAALPVLLRSVPPGSTVMVDIPGMRRGVWFWSWALPFALEQPFVREDLYRQFAIVEWPLVYCCVARQWWAAKQPALGPILQSTGTHELTYIVPDQRDSGLIVEKRTVSGPAWRTKIEAAIGRPVDTLATSITQDEAERVAEILFEVPAKR
jgi:Dolichyl-phosphate-mannose-protein mannosyltransferase